uniref:Uncharacterized protein n=1 Tax=viral metagenome TaxID=1070528 RepID=A0A6C0D8I4_9ZZZZ
MEQQQKDDQIIKEFRRIIQTIKKNVLNKLSYESNDLNTINKIVKRFIQFYIILKPVIYDNKSIETIPIEELKDLFYETLEEYNRSPYYQNKLEYYLKRDFIDFPLSLDEEQIDSFDIVEHYEEPRIVENNTMLTE